MANKPSSVGEQMISVKRALRALSLVSGVFLASLLAPPANAEKLDAQLFTLVKIDQLEYRQQDGNDLIVWEGQGGC